MKDSVVVAVFVIVIASIILYSKYLETQRDIHVLALEDQSSVSSTRNRGETAIYRSPLVPHSYPLLHGLSIRNSFSLRDGNIRDVWSVALAQVQHSAAKHHATSGTSFSNPQPSRIAEGFKPNEVCFYDSNGSMLFSKDYYQLNFMFKKLAKCFDNCLDNLDGHKLNWKVGSVLPVYTYQSFLASMACFLNSFTFHTFHDFLPQTALADFSLDFLLLQQKDLDMALKVYSSLVKIFIVTDILEIPVQYEISLTENPKMKVITWDQFMDFAENDFIGDSDSQYQYQYNKSYDDFIPLRETKSYNTTEYTNQNLVSSIANELKSIPSNESWNDKSLLFFAEDSQCCYFYNKILTAVLSGSSIRIVEPLRLNKIMSFDIEKELLEASEEIDKKLVHLLSLFNEALSKKSLEKSCIAVIPGFYLKSYLNLSCSNITSNWLTNILKRRSINLFKQGIHNRLGEESEIFSQTDLIYSYSTNNKIDSNIESYNDTNQLRVSTGAKIVMERYLCGTLGPVLSTNIYDYRPCEYCYAENDAICDSNRSPMINRGVASQVLEMKLIDYKVLGIDLKAEDNKGELCIRGFNIGNCIDSDTQEIRYKESERAGQKGWMPTGILGYFDDDGCFYEKLYTV